MAEVHLLGALQPASHGGSRLADAQGHVRVRAVPALHGAPPQHLVRGGAFSPGQLQAAAGEGGERTHDISQHVFSGFSCWLISPIDTLYNTSRMLYFLTNQSRDRSQFWFIIKAIPFSEPEDIRFRVSTIQ